MLQAEGWEADPVPLWAAFSFNQDYMQCVACGFLGIILLPLPTGVYSCDSVCICAHVLTVHRIVSYRNYSVVCFLAERKRLHKIQPCCSKETLRMDVKYISLEGWLCDGL